MMVVMRNPPGASDPPDPDARQRALLAETALGDRRAFQRLYALTYPGVLGFAIRLMSRHDRAEEIANDTMVAVWRQADRFEGRSKVSTWMFGIAYRIAMKAHHRDRGERMHVGLEAADDIICTSAPDAATLIEAEALKTAIAALPSDMRAIMVMTYQYGFTVAEVADVTGSPEGTIKTRMAAARRRMRELLESGTEKSGTER